MAGGLIGVLVILIISLYLVLEYVLTYEERKKKKAKKLRQQEYHEKLRQHERKIRAQAEQRMNRTAREREWNQLIHTWEKTDVFNMNWRKAYRKDEVRNWLSKWSDITHKEEMLWIYRLDKWEQARQEQARQEQVRQEQVKAEQFKEQFKQKMGQLIYLWEKNYQPNRTWQKLRRERELSDLFLKWYDMPLPVEYVLWLNDWERFQWERAEREEQARQEQARREQARQEQARREQARQEQARRARRTQWWMSSSPYMVLGIAVSATKVEIKKAYRKLALQYHPDRTQTRKEEYHLIFININNAYDRIK